MNRQLFMLGPPGVCLLMLGACSGPPAVEAEPPPPIPVHRASSEPSSVAPADIPDLTSTRAAVDHVATLGSLVDNSTRQEILLHAALYRSACRSNVGKLGRFVLEPIDLDVAIPISIEDREFRMRVLAELDDLLLPICWTPQLSPRRNDQDRFPGTSRPATRLTIRILARENSGLTVVSTVADVTAGVGQSRQAVVAKWTGSRWELKRSSVRVIH